MSLYANVIVPVPIPGEFTYRVPDDMEGRLAPLSRVAVPFGQNKFYTAIVTDITDTFDGDFEIKEIAWCPDSAPILRKNQLKLWHWIADYYMCSLGDVFRAALPSGLKIESETLVSLNPDFDFISGIEGLTPKMLTVLSRLKEEDVVSVREFSKSGIKDVMSVIYELMEKGAVSIYEKLTERFRPKHEDFITITLNRSDVTNELKRAFSKIKNERQQQLLMRLLQLSDFAQTHLPLREISKESIKAEEYYNHAFLSNFVKKGFINIENREISRFKWNEAPLKPLPELSTAQKSALSEVHTKFGTNSVVLLHGVTSSGKTEIYIHLIDFVLKQKRQILYLVPEIALTTQLTGRLQAVFGDKVIIYHSRFSDAERSEIWLSLLRKKEPCVIIGARSSVFLPFADLGLVIVDEEHEASYKQYDPAPRYNARDVATVLARIHNAKTLLASATPTIETYYKAETGRYGLVTLNQRFGDVKLPDIDVIDMKANRLKGQVVESFSTQTLELCREALGRKEQVIMFNNRRGYSPIARCRSCEYVPKCTDCDVSLTYHKTGDKLMCHYCGKEYKMPNVCPVCKQPGMVTAGYGTQRVEDNITESFPNAKILRMDLDTTRNKNNYAEIIERFSEHKADILVGTQMVTKGLDFADVSTVAVLNADVVLSQPDFRSAERAFNMLVQVAGRAGRRAETSGRVLIQTYSPQSPVIDFAREQNYNAFYQHELQHREEYGYPPFARIIYIIIRHKNADRSIEAAQILSDRLKAVLGNRIFGPQEPGVNRIKTYHLRRIMVKVEPTVSVSQVKDILRSEAQAVKSLPNMATVDIYFDVDPD